MVVKGEEFGVCKCKLLWINNTTLNKRIAKLKKKDLQL